MLGRTLMIAVVGLWAGNVYAGEGVGRGAWEKYQETDGVLIERRPAGRDGLYELRASSHTSATPERMIETTWGHDHYTKFVPRLKTLEILKNDGTTKIIYQTVSMPLIQDRDYTTKTYRIMDSKTRVYEQRFETTNEGPGPRDGYSRVQQIKGGWTMSIDDAGTGCDVVYQLFTDPGESLPAWMVAKAQTQTLPDLVKAFIARAERR